MATALFITSTDLKRNTFVNGNVSVDYFIQFVKIAQQIHIQNYCGTKLYDKLSDLITSGDIDLAGNAKYKTLIQDHLKDMLIHYSMIDYLPFASYQVSSGGIYKYNSENSEIATKEEVDSLIDKHRNFAQFYTRRFIDFMNFNQADYPEYYQNQDDDMYPDRDATFTGWVL